MPYKLGEEEAIFCGHSLSQERVSLSLSHVQLFKPFLQVLLFFLGIVEATAEYSSVAKKKEPWTAQLFVLFETITAPTADSSVCLYILSRLSSPCHRLLPWDILYIAFFFFKLFGGHNSNGDLFLVICELLKKVNLISLRRGFFKKFYLSLASLTPS